MSGPLARVLIRPMLASDAPAVLAIYQAGLDEGDASFETTAPAWPEFDASRLPGLRFVAAAADGSRCGRHLADPVGHLPGKHRQPCGAR